MSGHDSSDQDILSSDSEESFENENNIGNHLQDLLGNSLHQTSLDGASLKEKKPVPADLDEDLGSRARFHEDSEKRHKQPYGAHLQGKFTTLEPFDIRSGHDRTKAMFLTCIYKAHFPNPVALVRALSTVTEIE